jgi:hypothetical protein
MAVGMDFGVNKYMLLGLDQRPAEMLRHVDVSLVARVDVHMQLVVQVNVLTWDN